MKRVAIEGDQARLIDVPEPKSVPDRSVIVRVDFAAFNGLDALRARITPTVWPGLEFSGTIVQVGEGVAHVTRGDKVMGLVAAGALAEYVVVPAATVISRPGWLHASVAGATLQTLTVAWDAVTQLDPQPDHTVAVRGANTMIGSCIAQLLRERGCRVSGIVRTKRNALPQFDATVLEAPSEWDGAFDRMFECVGARYLDEDFRLLREGGSLLLLGGMGESRVAIDALTLMQKRLTIIGTTFNSRSEVSKRRVMADVEREMLPRLRTGAVSVPVAKVVPGSQAGPAFDYFQRGPAGKVVLDFTGH